MRFVAFLIAIIVGSVASASEYSETPTLYPREYVMENFGKYLSEHSYNKRWSIMDCRERIYNGDSLHFMCSGMVEVLGTNGLPKVISADCEYNLKRVTWGYVTDIPPRCFR